MTMIFDTLKVVKKLRENGMFTEEQAEVMAEAFTEGSVDNLVTRNDLRATAAELRIEIANLRTEIKAEIASIWTEIAQLLTEMREMENRLFVRLSAVIGLGVTITGLLIHFVK